MADGASRKISPASARAHTRKRGQNSSSGFPPGIMTGILLVSLIGFLAYAYKAIQPPPAKICDSVNGLPVTAPRIKLRDGRHLAYKEHGVPREKAKYKIVYVHGVDSCRHDAVVATELSPELFEELGLYIVSFDRPGYGESDPNPKITDKSTALDIEELADQLELGSKFYVIGFSLGGEIVWTCLKYLPHRLAGATLIAPVVNYWWSGLPVNLTNEAYYHFQPPRDQWAVRVSHYAPWLMYWWNTQKWFPPHSVVTGNPSVMSRRDMELVPKLASRGKHAAQVRQQGLYVSVLRDTIFAFGNWNFSPLELQNPFPDNSGAVHLWHSDDDLLVPSSLNRYIAQQLPWIHYHELPGRGHMFPYEDGIADIIVKTLILGEKQA
uniref:AB hydrolase-1 domain-containing protein n=1 Tax=Kalanchoe fedtschenkoi TaxID=63787 RepID=A0A7N0V146_KALFE